MADPKPEKQDSIIMSVRLRSGKFESSIEVPMYATPDEMREFAMAWLKLMEYGIKIGQGKQTEET
jgi:hypothetical protein